MTTRTARTVCNFNLNVMRRLTCVTPLSFEFSTEEPVSLIASGHVVLKHRGNYPAGVGWGLKLGLRGPFVTLADLRATYGATSQPPTLPSWIYGGVSSGNIEPAALHYFAAPISGAREISAPGYYRAEVWANCHGSTAGPALSLGDSVVELLIEGGEPQNSVTWRLESDPLLPARLPG